MNIDRKFNTNEEFRSASLPKRGLLDAVLSRAGEGLLSFAKFSGLVVTTSISDIEEGLRVGGALAVKPSQVFTKDPVRIQEWRLTNESFSAFYMRSWVNDELRETLHMIRPSFNGGAILAFTDGALVHGVVNAVKRITFSEEETRISKSLLETVRNRVSGEANE